MPNSELIALGQRVAELRIARQLKQTELAYEAGVSHRTLQRLEAGEAVKSDGLLKVIKCLGRLENVLAALDSPTFSPYEKLAEAGLKVSQLKPQRSSALLAGESRSKPGVTTHKRRVRRARTATPQPAQPAGSAVTAVKVQWPEDQR
jgi:transcriptional regulator with XRE-family HTH domain